MKIVEVVWDDAHCSTEDITIKQARKVKPVRTNTIGYLVAENEEGLVLATDRYPKQPKFAKVHNFVPWGMVVEYWELCEVP